MNSTYVYGQTDDNQIGPNSMVTLLFRILYLLLGLDSHEKGFTVQLRSSTVHTFFPSQSNSLINGQTNQPLRLGAVLPRHQICCPPHIRPFNLAMDRFQRPEDMNDYGESNYCLQQRGFGFGGRS